MAGEEPNRAAADAGDANRVQLFSSRRRHTRFDCDWSSDVCSSDLATCATPRPPISSFAASASFGLTRSEEHTSELQSQSNLVCRLLLVKKSNQANPVTEISSSTNFTTPREPYGSF